MELRKIFSAVCIIFISFMSFPQLYTHADDSTGLITKCSLSCEEYESGKLKISAKTQASGMMSEIGFENITIQYSDDGINWYNEKNIGSMTKFNASHYSVDGITTDIAGGHLYRVTCTHTATGNLFMNDNTFTQTAVHFSKSVLTEKHETYSSSYDECVVPSTTVSTEVSTTSTSSTTTMSETTSYTSSGSSTVSTSSSALTTTTVKQESSSVRSSSSVSSDKINTNRIYEYFCDGSPLTGVSLPTGSIFMLVLSSLLVIKLKKK